MRSRASNNSPNGRKPRKRAPRNSASVGNHRPLKFEIHSDLSEGHEVQKRIIAGIEKLGFDQESTFAIKLALEEALINAIKHGNKRDRKKKIHIEVRVTPKRAEIMIEDEGPGFRRADVPDPTAEENLCKCTGRGILLMENFMDQVQWSHGGRRVKMVKKNEAK
jgi:serine/threonine-protein kinase RsbW